MLRAIGFHLRWTGSALQLSWCVPLRAAVPSPTHAYPALPCPAPPRRRSVNVAGTPQPLSQPAGLQLRLRVRGVNSGDITSLAFCQVGKGGWPTATRRARTSKIHGSSHAMVLSK